MELRLIDRATIQCICRVNDRITVRDLFVHVRQSESNLSDLSLLEMQLYLLDTNGTRRRIEHHMNLHNVIQSVEMETFQADCSDNICLPESMHLYPPSDIIDHFRVQHQREDCLFLGPETQEDVRCLIRVLPQCHFIHSVHFEWSSIEDDATDLLELSRSLLQLPVLQHVLMEALTIDGPVAHTLAQLANLHTLELMNVSIAADMAPIEFCSPSLSHLSVSYVRSPSWHIFLAGPLIRRQLRSLCLTNVDHIRLGELQHLRALAELTITFHQSTPHQFDHHLLNELPTLWQNHPIPITSTLRVTVRPDGNRPAREFCHVFRGQTPPL